VVRRATNVGGHTNRDVATTPSSCCQPPPPDFELRSKPDSPASRARGRVPEPATPLPRGAQRRAGEADSRTQSARRVRVVRSTTNDADHTNRDVATTPSSCCQPPPPDFELRSKPDSPASRARGRVPEPATPIPRGAQRRAGEADSRTQSARRVRVVRSSTNVAAAPPRSSSPRLRSSPRPARRTPDRLRRTRPYAAHGPPPRPRDHEAPFREVAPARTLPW